MFYIQTMFPGRVACMVVVGIALLVACASDASVAMQDEPAAMAATPSASLPARNTSIDDAPTDQKSELDVNSTEPQAASAPPTEAAVRPDPTATATPDPTVVPTSTPTQTPVPETAPRCVRLTNFALDAENFGWFIVNDNVMGGRSSGGPTFENSTMVFEGEIDTNGGGFSSVRAQIGPTTLAESTHLIVRARPDERTYKVILEDGLQGRDRRISQQQTLTFGPADEDGWQTARIDFDQLDPRIFGRGVDASPFRPDLATQLGIMISDGIDGPFRIEIDWIDACRSN